ncbi:single-stranded DNA-binding protein [Hymenobacter sp. DG01]|uniref:single-stranded DNA-binding protein n=1 Tax=Hymenobacter sp. DG01 TaxID=2584940 RepID=UPI0011218645|nr:single-stranded DNA-binding protein [Hymenobacter sp. DG01]
MHQITLTGNLGKDAVVRDVKGSKAIGFSVAVNEHYTKQGGEKVEQTTWYDCTIWRKEGQKTTIADYLKEGQQVLIQGTPKASGYQNAQKEWVPTIEVRVTSIELVGKKAAAATTGGSQSANNEAGAFTSDDDNDLPF